MKRKILLWSVSAVLLVALSGCNLVFSEEAKKKDIRVEEGDAERLIVDLSIGAGELNVSGGAEDWVNGDIRYSNKKLDPHVTYDHDRGVVRIDQNKTNMNFGRETINEWNLQLTNNVPLDLEVDVGASKSDLKLSGLHLNNLDIDSGVGKLTVDLSGDWSESFDVNVESGVGKTTFILPSNVGVKIKANSGIGATSFEGYLSKGEGVYVNEAYGKSNVTIDVNADIGVGKTVFKEE